MKTQEQKSIKTQKTRKHHFQSVSSVFCVFVLSVFSWLKVALSGLVLGALLTSCTVYNSDDEVIRNELELATPDPDNISLEKKDVILEEVEELNISGASLKLSEDGTVVATPTPQPKKVQLDASGNFVDPNPPKKPYLNEAGEYVAP